MDNAELQRLANAVVAAIEPQLSAIHGRIGHLAVKVQVVADQWDAADDRAERRLQAAEKTLQGLRGLAMKLNDVALHLTFSRAAALLLPTPSRLAALAAGAAVGGFVATWLWLSTHAHTLTASLLP